MANTEHLMDELHGLAERIRRQRAATTSSRLKDKAELAALEAQMVVLWNDIRAARAEREDGPAPGLAPRTTRPKWG